MTLTMSNAAATGTINLAPPEAVLDARQLDRLIDLWLTDGVKNPETAAGYDYKLRYFRDWWNTNGPQNGWVLRRRDLVTFADSLETTRTRFGVLLSYHTRNDILRRLRQMFHWAYRGGFTDGRDYAAWVPSTDGEPPRRKPASLAALTRLFEAAAASPFPARDQAILAVLIGTGIRRGECASMRVERLVFRDDGSGLAVVMGKRTKANRSGEREVAFDAATGDYLQAYLDASKLDMGPLWPGPRGPLTTQGIYRVVKRAASLADLEAEIQGCHDLRRAFATHLARKAVNAVDSDLLRRQLGHTSYRMTAHYTLLDAEDVRERLHSPMNEVVAG